VGLPYIGSKSEVDPIPPRMISPSILFSKFVFELNTTNGNFAMTGFAKLNGSLYIFMHINASDSNEMRWRRLLLSPRDRRERLRLSAVADD
jgi:hypothetical protein